MVVVDGIVKRQRYTYKFCAVNGNSVENEYGLNGIKEKEKQPASSMCQLTGYLRKENVFGQLCYFDRNFF